MEGKFYLRKKDSKGNFTVYLYQTINKKQVYVTTGLKAAERDWNGKKMEFKHNETANAILESYRKAVTEFAAKVEGLGVAPTNDQLKQYVSLHLSPIPAIETAAQEEAQPVEEKPQKAVKTSFFNVIDKFIADAPNRLNANGERITQRRVDMYCYERKALKEFEEKNRLNLSFENFDKNTLTAFQTFLTKKGLANNTIVRYIRLLFVFFRYAEDTHNIKVNQAFRKYKTHTNKKDSVVLNEVEIGRIWDYQPANAYEENVRKLFLIGLHTGLRFSDYTQLEGCNVDENNGTITMIQQKTGQRVTLPLHPRLGRMLATEELPHAISNQRFNKYLKELMQKVGFEEVVEIKKVIGGQRIIERKQKWELISSHTARRSFATNLYKAGVNPSIIMLCTGHHDLQSFMKYIVLDDNDKLQVVRNLWANLAV